jgi:glycogen(starch) synthase
MAKATRKPAKIKTSKVTKSKPSYKPKDQSLVMEASWEVCNQVGGIYTVLRSKVSSMIEEWGDNYCMIGPYLDDQIQAELDPLPVGKDPYGKAVQNMQKAGFKVHYARWLITGRPKVILLDINSVKDQLNKQKFYLWEYYNIGTPPNNELINQVILFNYLLTIFFQKLGRSKASTEYNLIAHIHEWLAGICVLDFRRLKLPVRTILTTHATVLGRHLAINSPRFYQHLPFFDWQKEAKHFNIEPEATIERYAAQAADLLTTVSDVTGKECEYLLGRKADMILPNGLNITRFEVVHEVQNRHQVYKEAIHEFVTGHFFQSYSWDLDKTLYFFTSGRFEYKNKGFDITIDALDLLNKKLRKEGSEYTVVMFFITKRPFYSINADVLQNKALVEEIRHNIEEIQKQIGQRLFTASTTSTDHKLPELLQFVDDYWRLRYRRTIQAWKTKTKPPMVTHNLQNEGDDEIINHIRTLDLRNDENDKVKIVYHPDFISTSNPLFAIDYGMFVRGCHLGIFPSYYEPWGYTPLECIARGVPSITSDLSGFGDYVIKNMKDHEDKGIYIVNRAKSDYKKSANQLADILFNFVKSTRRERIAQRNTVESSSLMFDWSVLISHYNQAYRKVLTV